MVIMQGKENRYVKRNNLNKTSAVITTTPPPKKKKSCINTFRKYMSSYEGRCGYEILIENSPIKFPLHG